MIDANCHGCQTPMSFEAVPVTLTDMSGERHTHYGKNSAAWICSTCRLDPRKLRAARTAAGLPAEANMPAGYDDDDEQEVS